LKKIFRINVLPAFYGDSIIISFGDENDIKNILIDGGTGNTYDKVLKKEILNIKSKGQVIDLLIITHIDDDHIGGIINLFQDGDFDNTLIKKVWFNSGKLISKYFSTKEDAKREIPVVQDGVVNAIPQGITLEKILKDKNIWEEKIISSEYNSYHELYNSKLYIVSPEISSLKKLNEKWEVETGKSLMMAVKGRNDHKESVENLVKNPFKKDHSLPNETSIAFIFEYDDKKILLLGDAHPSIIIKSLDTLKEKTGHDFKYVKLPHHGSKGNLNNDLIKKIDCKNFIISSNGEKFELPDKESLSRLIKNKGENLNFYFNYDNEFIKGIFTEEELKKYKINQLFKNNIEVKD
jgi:beta-lactamase superfamily II metal-dependent hydrolase